VLAGAVEHGGGRVLYRREAARIVLEGGRPRAVETKRGEVFDAGTVVANLPPWNIARLLGDHAPPRLRRLPQRPRTGWGASMVYVGLDEPALPHDFPLHHQVIIREPLGEANTVFLSLSPAWDAGRAPAGRRALTISTHTAFGPWWVLFESDRAAYEGARAERVGQMLDAAERAIPGLREAAELVLPGTPVTFRRFTRREWGWVGGFPQTSLFTAWGPRIAPGLWMVGDSIFPGQSIPAVALGGLRVARAILRE
jgi:phytoene dehydrogenase-like protein